MDRRCFLTGAAMTLTGLGTGSPAEGEPGLKIEIKDGVLAARWQGRPLLTYQGTPLAGPPGTGPLFTRSGYLHPVYAPCGALLTDDFPADHLHQRGVFFAWTKTQVTLGGEVLHPDFWNLGAGTGRVRCAATPETIPGPGTPGFHVKHAWEARRGENWEEVLAETWEVRFPDLQPKDPAAPGAAFVIDLTSRQTPRVALELPEYRYGGMCVRGPRPWVDRQSGWTALTSEGKDRATADNTRARWVQMGGRIDDRPAGIALLEHPANSGAPNPLRLPPELPYEVFSPPRAGSLTLAAGKEHVFRYRIVIHNGPADAAALEALWKSLAG